MGGGRWAALAASSRLSLWRIGARRPDSAHDDKCTIAGSEPAAGAACLVAVRPVCHGRDLGEYARRPLGQGVSVSEPLLGPGQPFRYRVALHLRVGVRVDPAQRGQKLGSDLLLSPALGQLGEATPAVSFELQPPLLFIPAVLFAP